MRIETRKRQFSGGTNEATFAQDGVLAIVSVVLSCAAAQTVAQGTPEDEEAIKRVVIAMDDTFNRHEPNASLFTRDADFVNVNGTWLKGAAEIENGRRAAF